MENSWFWFPMLAVLAVSALALLVIACRYKATPPCEHNFTPMDTIRVQGPGEPALAIIYLHHCAKCGAVKKTRISNHGN